METMQTMQTVEENLIPAIPEEVQSGYKTTEFWITLVSTIVPNVITLLVLAKAIPGDIASTLSSSIVAVISGIITIFVTLKYNESRTELKRAILQERYASVRTRNDIIMNLHSRGLIDGDRVKRELKF